jgi:Tfp pilus assembly protein PilX
MNIFHTQQQKGFVILFAVLISAIILMIGAGVLSISVKETLLSSTARESQLAINAADSGVECALYREFVNSTATCFNQIPTPTSDGFDLAISESGQDTCVRVTIDRNFNASLNQDEVKVISRGFNVCVNETPLTSDPLLLERVYRVTYYTDPVPTP